MYLGEHPLVHLSTGRVPATRSSDAFDHLALRCEGLPAFEEKFKGLGIDFEGYLVPDQGMYQIFLRDPEGMVIELIFDAAESAHKAGQVPAHDATVGRYLKKS